MAVLPTIKSPELERRVLSGLLAHGSRIWATSEISEFLKDEDFYSEKGEQTNLTLFRVCRSLLEANKDLDPVIVSEKFERFNISVKLGRAIDFIESLLLAPPNEAGLIDAVKELKLITIKRNYVSCYREAAKFVCDYKGDSLSEMVSELDKITSKQDEIYVSKHEPINVFDDAEYLMEQWGLNPRDSLGIKTHLPSWNKLLEGVAIGEATMIAARRGAGKSAIMADIGFNAGNKIDQSKVLRGQSKVPCLFIDTEMSREQMTGRLVAQIANVNYAYLRKGTWRNNEEMTRRVRGSYEDLKKFNFDHVFVGNADVMEIMSVIKKWVLSKVGRDQYFMVFWDYIKEANNKRNGLKEYELIGNIFDQVKNLIKDNYPKGSLIGAVQANRQGNAGKNGPDDSDDAIALSDRLSWYCSSLVLLRKKTADELQEEPIELFGSRKVIPLKIREGNENADQSEFVEINKKVTRNWINLSYGHYAFKDEGDAFEYAQWLQLKENTNSDTQNRGEYIP